MSENCIEPFLKGINGDCNAYLANVYVMHKMSGKSYNDCTLTQVAFYAKNCVDVENPCHIHKNVKHFVARGEATESFISCIFEQELATTRLLLFHGASCTDNESLAKKYAMMKNYEINQNCPDKFNTGLTAYEIKHSNGNFCKQFVELYEEYCF